MAQKQETQAEGNVLSQYAALKQKHPDAMLMFRQGDFYELFKEDAVKAAVILTLNVSEKILPQEKNPVKAVSFPYHALDVNLPKLIRAGHRVAICDQIESRGRTTTERSSGQSGRRRQQRKAI